MFRKDDNRPAFPVAIAMDSDQIPMSQERISRKITSKVRVNCLVRDRSLYTVEHELRSMAEERG